ncbi:MAG: sugar kinase [Anaerolineales bacterium]|nr:sugar kinase [Anaerolineales bacterium]
MPHVIILGDACVDMAIHLPDRSRGMPDLSQSVPHLFGGGSGANVAVALARLGADVGLIGAVGDDGYGRWVRDDLAREGVDVRGISTVTEAFTPMVIAMIEPNGERLVVVWPPEKGAHVMLKPAAVDRQLLTTARWLHVTGMVLRDSPVRETTLQAMALARAAGVTVSLDLNLRIELWGLEDDVRATFHEAARLADVVLGNAWEELVPLTGAATVQNASRQLGEGKRVVVARQGAQGALVTTPTESFAVPAFPAQVLDTLGAGDAFNGGFIAAALTTGDIFEAARWGNGVAALKISRPGARGLPSLPELQALLWAVDAPAD